MSGLLSTHVFAESKKADSGYRYSAAIKFGVANETGFLENFTQNWGCPLPACAGDVNYGGTLSSDDLLATAGLYLGIESAGSFLYHGIKLGGTYVKSRQSVFVDTNLRDYPEIDLKKSYSREHDGYLSARIQVGLSSLGWTPYVMVAPIIGKTSYSMNFDQNSGDATWTKSKSGWKAGYEFGGGLMVDLFDSYSISLEYSEINYFNNDRGLMDANLPQFEMGYFNEDKLRQVSLFVTRKF